MKITARRRNDFSAGQELSRSAGLHYFAGVLVPTIETVTLALVVAIFSSSFGLVPTLPSLNL